MGLCSVKDKLVNIENGGLVTEHDRLSVLEASTPWYSECVNEGIVIGIIDEKAHFSFLPKFKDIERDDLRSALSDAEIVLNSNGEASIAGVEKVFAIIFKILKIYDNIISVLSLVYCVTIIGIIPHLIIRAWTWAMDIGEDYFVKEQTKKTIAQLEGIKSKTKDSRKKAEIDKTIKRLKEKLEANNK